MPSIYEETEDPNAPTPTDTPFPSQTPLPSNTPFRALSQLECALEGDLLHCSDHILNIEFSYPSKWGTVTTLYRNGQEGGAAYNYFYPASSTIEAGGRSKDFAESRGGTFSDFKGLSTNESDPCSRSYNPYCEKIQPNVKLEIQFNTADQNWPGPGPWLGVEPMVWIKINLPANPRINGFLFAFCFHSNEQTNRLFQALECTVRLDAPRVCFPICSDENRAEFDVIREEILSEIADRTIDSETTSSLNVLRRLAESIVIK